DIIDDLSDIDKNSYAKVVDHLRTHFESPQFRSLARQQLSDCKQGPTESAREFADRIKQIVKKVTRGQPKQAQNERLLDEFQDRLKPALRFHVKAANPLTFEEAVVKATTYESLLNDVASAITIFPGTQPTAPPPVRVVAARNTSAPLGPDQYRQRFPRQQRRKSRTYYPSNNRSRRFWERAPNADIICYRCGRKACRQPAYSHPNYRRHATEIHLKTFPGFPVMRIKVTMSPTPFRVDPYMRDQGGEMKFSQQDTSNDGIQSTDTVSEEDKDARIAALIERNNALADLVFATQNTTISDEPDGEPGNRPTTSSKTPAWAYMPPHCLQPYLCSNRSPLSYWKIPEQINCSRILPPWSSTPQFLSLNVYRPNTIRYQSMAHVCRIISQTVVYSVNFFGARSQSVSTHENAVPVGVCQHMVRHKSCANGELLSRRHGLENINRIQFEWPSAPSIAVPTTRLRLPIGYGIEILHAKGRSKREILNPTSQQVGLATTNQLAAQLLAVEGWPTALAQCLFPSFYSSPLQIGEFIESHKCPHIRIEFSYPSHINDARRFWQRCSDIAATSFVEPKTSVRVIYEKSSWHSCRQLPETSASLYTSCCHSIPHVSRFQPYGFLFPTGPIGRRSLIPLQAFYPIMASHYRV
ncbi:hypothetical protein OSTOST_25387, partial [Ostertagia ostertagi]